MENQKFIICNNLVKIYKIADLEVVALQGLDLEVEKGEMMALVGPSGSGKSTLLNVMGGLDTPSVGQITVGNYDLLNMDARQRVRYKREIVGFLWQQPTRNLLAYISARENIELPLMLTQRSSQERKARSQEILEVLGLAERADFNPDQLSGGEQQLVALGVALANNPQLLLVDEPTGQLDSESAEKMFEALREINKIYDTTIIIVTHDPEVAALVDRVVGIRDGRTSTEIRRERSHEDGSVLEEEWVILDRTGRMQIPQVYADALAMRGRVKIRLEPDHVSVWPGYLEGDDETLRVWRPDQTFDLGEKVADLPPVDKRSLAVETNGLCRTFDVGVETIHAVRDVDLAIPEGVLAVLKGRSGAGKTTLLNLIGGLDEPTKGRVIVGEKDITQLTSREKVNMRRKDISYVFQTFGLMPVLSAKENVEAPLRLVRSSGRDRRSRSDEVLRLVGLSQRANHRAFELSGGEQQRVAVARSLANRPRLILADEPTGQLDTVTGSNIIALLKEVVLQSGITVVIASHDPKVEEAADCVYELRDGRLISSEIRI